VLACNWSSVAVVKRMNKLIELLLLLLLIVGRGYQGSQSTAAFLSVSGSSTASGVDIMKYYIYRCCGVQMKPVEVA
jgi:hypothetical protein